MIRPSGSCGAEPRPPATAVVMSGLGFRVGGLPRRRGESTWPVMAVALLLLLLANLRGAAASRAASHVNIFSFYGALPSNCW